MNIKSNDDSLRKVLLKLNRHIKKLSEEGNLNVEDRRELLSITYLVFSEECEHADKCRKLFGSDEEFMLVFQEVIRPKVMERFAGYLNTKSKEHSDAFDEYSFLFPEKQKFDFFDNDVNMINVVRKFVKSSEDDRGKIFNFLLSTLRSNVLLFGPHNISVAKIQRLYNYLVRLNHQYFAEKNHTR